MKIMEMDLPLKLPCMSGNRALTYAVPGTVYDLPITGVMAKRPRCGHEAAWLHVDSSLFGSATEPLASASCLVRVQSPDSSLCWQLERYEELG